MSISRSAARLVAPFLVAGAFSIGGGCGGDDGPKVAGGDGARGGTSSGGSSSGDGSAAGGSSGVGGGVFFDGSLSNDGALTADSACAGETFEGEIIPLAMYIMLDRTGSMNEESPSKWNQAVTALTQFVNDPASAGIKIAIQTFADSPCDGSVYDTPAVPMAPLPTNAQPVISYISGITPSGGTPTEGALRGLTSFCASYATANPSETVVGLIVTDGEPTRCDRSASTLTGIVAGALAGTPSILTFAMGMNGADFGLMNQIAAAGGTMMSFDASGGAASFVQALEAIRGIALQCEYSLPESTSQMVDPEKVNVEFNPSGQLDGGPQTPQQLGKVDSEAACAGVPWGWYYDDNMNPTTIFLCPQTCDEAKKDPNGRVEIIVGCTSLPPV